MPVSPCDEPPPACCSKESHSFNRGEFSSSTKRWKRSGERSRGRSVTCIKASCRSASVSTSCGAATITAPCTADARGDVSAALRARLPDGRRPGLLDAAARVHRVVEGLGPTRLGEFDGRSCRRCNELPADERAVRSSAIAVRFVPSCSSRWGHTTPPARERFPETSRTGCPALPPERHFVAPIEKHERTVSRAVAADAAVAHTLGERAVGSEASRKVPRLRRRRRTRVVSSRPPRAPPARRHPHVEIARVRCNAFHRPGLPQKLPQITRTRVPSSSVISGTSRAHVR